MNPHDFKYFDVEQLPGGQLTPELASELAHMRYVGRTWTTHGPWSDNAAAIAGRVTQLALDETLSRSRPGMVLTGGREESEAITARLQSYLPELVIRNLTVDDRLSPGRSKACRDAVTEEAAVRVITYRMFREARQSFWGAGGPVVFLEQADRLADGGQDYEFTKQLAHKAGSVHLFTTVGLLNNPGATFHLGSLLRLPHFPRSLQRFKTAYVKSIGHGLNEVMAWRHSAMSELAELLDLHHHERAERDVPLND
ncbi:hypothetical protein [Geodermatophilus normandii]|uniref:Uncharacterized protein n=1 Tax=Geodermatophilus normandii TaxID=1137989 RepID=A0A6P0GL31_9ACTN|nr:hypothetical protein [Geodermatophilus normandii]NEM07742.1 hypothetical protein [Geodermatophilus normandii]